MRFTLTYRGPLKANGDPTEKQRIRRYFHPQLARLWTQPPLSDLPGLLGGQSAHGNVLYTVLPFTFAAIVSSRLHMYAGLEVDFLRPGPPGQLITSGGDIDNRLKTLLDALAVPQPGALPARDLPSSDETILHCLLEDDALIGSLTVQTDRLLDTDDAKAVQLQIRVQTYQTRIGYGTIGLL